MGQRKQLIRDLLLKSIYDRRVNQGMWLACATGSLGLFFYLSPWPKLAVYAILAIFPTLMAGIDQPGPHFSSRMVRIDLLFFAVSLLVLSLVHSSIPLVAIFFPLIFLLAMFAVRGNGSGRIGTAAMIVATLSLSWPDNQSQPFWILPFLIGFGTLWYGVAARVWMFWWGHRMLRDHVAQLFTEIADYYRMKSQLFQKEPSKEEFRAVFSQQETVYGLINQCKVYLNRFGEEAYNRELQRLEKDYFFAVDLMELLQANKHRVDEIRDFIQTNQLGSQYSDFVFSLAVALKRKAFAVRTRRQVEIKLDEQVTAFENDIKENREFNPLLSRSLAIHFDLIRSLLAGQGPAFQRSLGVPDPPPGFVAALRPHLNFKSPVFRYALRLSVTVCGGILLAGALNLEKSYWVILAILLVMQSGYLLTKTLITQRVLGTLIGVLLGLGIIYLPLDESQLVLVMAALAIFTFSMVFIHRIWSVIGTAALIVVAYQVIFELGEMMVFTRAVDTVLGCGLAFISNILLWPQWNGGGIKRLLKETLAAQEDILSILVRALADPTIGFEQLTRRRFKLYTAQNNLLASYQQMLREPHHTQQYVDSLENVISHFVATSAHINGLLPMTRVNVPLTSDLTKHLERLITVLFNRCDEGESGSGDIILEDELKCVYHEIENMKQNDGESQHYAIVHLLELIFERLNAIFDGLDFCKRATVEKQQTET